MKIMIVGAIDDFVLGASVDMPRGIRINAVSNPIPSRSPGRILRTWERLRTFNNQASDVRANTNE